MTCRAIGEFLFWLNPLTCADIGEFLKVVCAVGGLLLAWKKANQVINLRRDDIDQRQRELEYLKGTGPR